MKKGKRYVHVGYQPSTPMEHRLEGLYLHTSDAGSRRTQRVCDLEDLPVSAVRRAAAMVCSHKLAGLISIYRDKSAYELADIITTALVEEDRPLQKDSQQNHP